MACNLKRIADLPIREDYKIAMIEHFQRPENQQACEELNQASDEQIIALIANMDETIAQQGGSPSGPLGGNRPMDGGGQLGAQQAAPQGGIGAMPQGRPPPVQPRGPVQAPLDMPQPGAPGGINMLPRGR